MQCLKVSIGICAYNEENNIDNLLKNLLDQALPSSFRLREIIVISSGSTDETNKIVSKMEAEDQRIELITEKERTGKAQALNIFLEKAKGDILVVVSADTKPLQGSLARLLESMKPNLGGACANTLPLNKNQTIMEFCNYFLWKVHNRVLFVESARGNLTHLGGDMWAVRKGIVDCIPKDVINDDAYLGMTLRKRGWQITFVPNSEVFIRGPATPLEFIHQRERIVIGHKQMEQMMGVGSSTIGAFVLRQPIFSLKMLAEEIKTNRILDYPKIFIGVFLEMVAQTLGRINFRRRSTYLKWKQIRSTKNV